MIEIVEAPLHISAYVAREEGAALSARMTVGRWGGGIQSAEWMTIDGWVVQGAQGCVFRTLKWPVTGRVKPWQAFSEGWSTLIPVGPQEGWSGFPQGVHMTGVIGYLFTIDTKEEA